jgi:hypothetical protein
MNDTAKFGYGRMAGEKPTEEEYAAAHALAMQDMEDLFYYWRGDRSRAREQLAELGFIHVSAEGTAMTVKGHAWVEEKRQQDPHYEADLVEFNRRHRRKPDE